MRVFELAKQLGITSKDLIGDLKGIGVTVSNHMAALEDDTVAKILAKAKGKAQKPASLVKLPKTVEAVKPGRPLEEKPDKPDKADKEKVRSEEHTSELQSRSDLVCRLLLEKKKHSIL